MKAPLARIPVLDKGYVELLSQLGDDNTIVSAARVSNLGKSKGPEKDRKLIQFMMEHRHTSPFEHVIFQWRIKCPLFVRSQWHRHRTWSYNELSRRYTSEDIEFYHPDSTWRAQDERNQQGSSGLWNGDQLWADAAMDSIIGFAVETYHLLLDRGISREMARMVLPQNLYTIFYGTVDLHNLLHFLGLRNHPAAQLEIRLYAAAMEEIISTRVPWTYDAWRTKNVGSV